jgi:predicted transposase YbfD/YdcC
MKETTISQTFGHLADPRVNRTKLHPLVNILTISLCAIISGCDDFCTIEEYGKTKQAWFEEFLDMPYGIPSHDTFNDVLNRLNPNAFAQAFTDWVSQLVNLNKDIVAIDGKVLRGTLGKVSKCPALHLVNAWSVENNLCLGQIKVSDKSNEITAIPKLLALLDIEGATITTDAMGCQFKIANQIVAAKGDYVLALKGSQGECFDDVQLFLNSQLEKGFDNAPHSYFESVNGDHGRIEQRQVWVTTDVAWLHERHPRWHSIKSVAVINSIREQGEQNSEEKRYFISSHSDKDAEFIAHAIRSHWHVENKLHWQLDISFNEDSLRHRSGHAAQNIALINKLALNLLKNEKSTKVGVKSKRLKAGWDNNYMMKVLSVGRLIV